MSLSQNFWRYHTCNRDARQGVGAEVGVVVRFASVGEFARGTLTTRVYFRNFCSFNCILMTPIVNDHLKPSEKLKVP